MRNVFEKIKFIFGKIKYFVTETFWFVFIILLSGLIGGLALFLTLAFLRHAYFITLIITAFFMLFHLSDMKEFYLTKNWIGFFGRFLVIFGISTYIGGFVGFFSGLIELKIDPIDFFLFVAVFFVSYPAVATYMTLLWFFPKSKIFINLQKIKEGLDVLGVIPK